MAETSGAGLWDLLKPFYMRGLEKGDRLRGVCCTADCA